MADTLRLLLCVSRNIEFSVVDSKAFDGEKWYWIHPGAVRAAELCSLLGWANSALFRLLHQVGEVPLQKFGDGWQLLTCSSAP